MKERSGVRTEERGVQEIGKEGMKMKREDKGK